MYNVLVIKHLYIHIPFCNSICAYCDFTRVGFNKTLSLKYLDALKKEFKQRVKEKTFETIYIGGGTPSSLDSEEFEDLLSFVYPYVKEDSEYTIELNPETITLEKVRLLTKYGVNRVSIGVQTFNDKLLKVINRKHTYKDIEYCISLLKGNGINNISIDLMYSLPYQTIDDLKEDLNKAISLNIEHISIYSLTIEENSEFKRLGLSNLDDETEADMYELIKNTLESNGYVQYEISNYCKDLESKHNLGYWKYEDYYGLGLGATSKINDQLIDNTKVFNKYLIGDYFEKEYDESIEERKFNNIMMSLRTYLGLDINEFNKKYNADFLNEYKDAISKHSELVLDERFNFLECTNLEILNEILLDFLK